MNAQVFTQVVMAFMAGVTGMNLFIQFLELAVEEFKKCSIMERRQKRVKEKKPFCFGIKRKTYAVVPCAGKAV